MPSLARPDGVEIHWEGRGEGPVALLASHAFAYPGVYAGLCDELSSDHRVVTYDPRGTGRSTRIAPTSPAQDVSDLEAVLIAVGGRAVVVALGDAGGRAATLAATRPDLVQAVVVVGASSVSPAALTRAEGPVSSPNVIQTLLEIADRNPRAAIRGMLELTNPGMTPEELRERVDASMAYSIPEAIGTRHRWFFEGDSLADMRALGPRLWVAHWESTWSPAEVAGELRRLLPESHIESLPEGAIARPDLTADLVRRAAPRADSHEVEPSPDPRI